ncbi:unnamed protein product [Acidithrix sp. C25]|nr:unnamed protein product [Acidithrix sp. C25]
MRILANVRSGIFDCLVVVVFVMIGRSAHGHGETIAGIVTTAWPFLSGTTLGWLIIRPWMTSTQIYPVGVVVWLSTVIFGQLFRVISGQGTALAFIGVSLGFLGLGLVGWRAVASFFSRSKGTFLLK